MHITRETPQELVVVHGSIWLSVLCAAAGLVLTCVAIVQCKPKGLLAAGLFLLFAALSARHITFTFDNMQRLVSWTGRKLFKVESGIIRFDDITDITVEALAGDTGITRRLAILTPRGSTPMAYAYSGVGNLARMRAEILEFIKPGSYVPASEPGILSDGIPADLESSIRSLLAQGRKIDAVALLRSRGHIGLTEAVSRIEEFDATFRQGS
jgi:hypothetical protein